MLNHAEHIQAIFTVSSIYPAHYPASENSFPNTVETVHIWKE